MAMTDVKVLCDVCAKGSIREAIPTYTVEQWSLTAAALEYN